MWLTRNIQDDNIINEVFKNPRVHTEGLGKKKSFGLAQIIGWRDAEFYKQFKDIPRPRAQYKRQFEIPRPRMIKVN